MLCVLCCVLFVVCRVLSCVLCCVLTPPIPPLPSLSPLPTHPKADRRAAEFDEFSMAWDDIASNIKLFLLTEQGKLALEKEVARRKLVRNASFYAMLCYAPSLSKLYLYI